MVDKLENMEECKEDSRVFRDAPWEVTTAGRGSSCRAGGRGGRSVTPDSVLRSASDVSCVSSVIKSSWETGLCTISSLIFHYLFEGVFPMVDVVVIFRSHYYK